MSTKVLLIDDHEVVRVGIRRLLEPTEFNVVAESATALNLVGQVSDSGAELLLLDVVIGSTNVFDELRMLKDESPGFPVLMISAFDNPTFVRQAIDLKAGGYVLKSADSRALIATMRKLIAKNTAWTSEDLRRVTGSLATPRLDLDDEVALTRRESQVLVLVVRGLTNKEIAVALKISYETVKEHVQHLLRKIGVSDRTQAAVWAVRKGIA